MGADEKTVTERDAVLRERAAYLTGRNDEGTGSSRHAWGLYPLPPRIEPRVEEDTEHVEWRYVDGQLWARQQVRGERGTWYVAYTVYDCHVTGRLTAIARVIANPTCEVPDNGD